jgi:transposase
MRNRRFSSTNAPVAPGGEARPERRVPSASIRDAGRDGREREVVLRILRGEAIDALSREITVMPARLAQWRGDFLAGGQSGIQVRDPDHRDDLIQDLKIKIGDQTMTIELLEKKISQLEDGLRFSQRRRSRCRRRRRTSLRSRKSIHLACISR